MVSFIVLLRCFWYVLLWLFLFLINNKSLCTPVAWKEFSFVLCRTPMHFMTFTYGSIIHLFLTLHSMKEEYYSWFECGCFLTLAPFVGNIFPPIGFLWQLSQKSSDYVRFYSLVIVSLYKTDCRFLCPWWLDCCDNT